jgi:predicted nuclease with TOPRIM domain
VWERLGELEQANSELQQKQLEFEREKYDLHKQIAQLQRKLEKRTLCSDLVLYFSLARRVNSHTWRRRRRG